MALRRQDMIAKGRELEAAIKGGNVTLVRDLCSNADWTTGLAADAAFADEFGFSMLHLAAKLGDADMIKLLVEFGAQVLLQNRLCTGTCHDMCVYLSLSVCV